MSFATDIKPYSNGPHATDRTREQIESQLNAREKERRQEVTPPVARTRRPRGEVSDDDEGDDDDANRVGAGAAA